MIVIYTDGSIVDGSGGWAALLAAKVTDGWRAKVVSGQVDDTTNNRMELMAVIEGLSALKRRSSVILYTDSQYVRRGITEWISDWKRRGWTRKEGELKNVDLWKQLDRLNQEHHVDWRWIKGHSGDYWNEFVDMIAGTEARKDGRDADIAIPGSDGYIQRDLLDRNGDPG